MAYYNSEITLGGNTLYIRSMRAVKRPGTLKQIIGRNVVELRTASRNIYDWNITISGIIFTDKETNRDLLEAMQDGTPYALVDGSHDGDYFIKNITFNDDGDTSSTIFSYTLELVQSNQPT